jgi:hypothetical protein
MHSKGIHKTNLCIQQDEQQEREYELDNYSREIATIPWIHCIL